MLKVLPGSILKKSKHMLNKMRKIERRLCRCPEIDCSDDAGFPLPDEAEFKAMEQNYCEDLSRVYIFPFVRENKKGVWYVDVYVWDQMLYPEAFRRFIICTGYCLPEILESSFLEYIKGNFACLDKVQMERFNSSIISKFPDWHYVRYPASCIGQALEHIYYASHRSGMREILYKADLNLIAFYLDKIPSCNLIGSTPKEIIGRGMPLNLLRILNHPMLIENLFSEESAEHCREVYKRYGGHIGRKRVSAGQWYYLDELYCNDGTFAGHGFIRALFELLSPPGSEFFLEDYAEFLRLRDEIADIKKVKLPGPDDVLYAVGQLKKISICRHGKTWEDILISARKKQAEYEYSGERYSVVMPGSAMDICQEALLQGNCVTDYLGDHASGKTTILFLRMKDRSEKPFVTLEVKDGAVRQVYGRYNSLPEKEVYIFLESFAKARRLLYDPDMLIFGNTDDIDDPECDADLLEYAEDFHRRNDPGAGTGRSDETVCTQITLEELYPEVFQAEKEAGSRQM